MGTAPDLGGTTAVMEVTEKQARAVAEAAREREWRLPSFGKQLFLGNFRLDLIPPQPRLDPAAVEKGEPFLAAAARLPADGGRPTRDRARRDDPRPRDRRSRRGSARSGIKVPGGVRRARPHRRSITTARSRSPVSGIRRISVLLRRTSRSAWPSRCGCSAPRSRSEVAAAGRQGPYQRVSADRARRRLGPGRRSASTAIGRDAGRRRLLDKRSQAVGHQRHDRRRSPWSWPRSRRARATAGGISAFVMPYDSEGVTVEHRNAFMGMHGIENSVTRLENVFVPEENLIGSRGRWSEDRAHHAEHGSAGADGELPSGLRSGRRRSRGSGPQSACSGAGRSASTTRLRRRWRSSPASAFGLEAMLDVAARLADNKAQRCPDRGRAAQGVRLGACLAGDRRAAPDPRRAWL